MSNRTPQTAAEQSQPPASPRERLAESIPRPTTQFRRRAWLEFQRAIDPLAPPRPPPPPP